MANLELWRNPWKDVTTFGRAMDRMLEDWALTKFPAETTKYGFSPSCEVKEDRANFYLRADLPGVPKEGIKVDLNDNRLTISAERSEEKKTEEKDHKTHFSEVFYGTYTRTMTFPTPVDPERVEAKYESGVLNLVIPKKSSGTARQISVK